MERSLWVCASLAVPFQKESNLVLGEEVLLLWHQPIPVARHDMSPKDPTEVRSRHSSHGFLAKCSPGAAKDLHGFQAIAAILQCSGNMTSRISFGLCVSASASLSLSLSVHNRMCLPLVSRSFVCLPLSLFESDSACHVMLAYVPAGGRQLEAHIKDTESLRLGKCDPNQCPPRKHANKAAISLSLSLG